MTSQIIATARWRTLDREGQETCRLSRSADGWMLVGHAQFRDDLGPASLNYVVRCSETWITQSADLAGDHDGREVKAHIVHENGQWWLDDKPQPDVSGASDIDLSFTPATNLMPLRRLLDPEHTTTEVKAAWLRYPCARLVKLDQTYRRNGVAGVVQYHAEQTDYSTTLSVDPSGFVTLYPDLWEGEVIHES